MGHHLEHLMAPGRGFPTLSAHRGRIAAQQAAVLEHHQLTGAAIEHQVQPLVIDQIGGNAAEGHVVADQRCWRWNRIRFAGQSGGSHRNRTGSQSGQPVRPKATRQTTSCHSNKGTLTNC